jgi:WD40 repeat protein
MPQAWVTFTGSAVLRVKIREPKLVLKVKCPDKGVVGEDAAFTLSVSNPGNSPTDGVKIHAVFSEGLEHSRGNKVDFDIGDLAAGESRNVTLLCVTRGDGVQKIDAVADAEGGLSARETGSVTISPSRRNLQQVAAGPRYVGRKPVSPEGKLILSAGEDKTIRIWDAVTGKELRTLTGHDEAVLAVACSPDGKLAASGGDDGMVRLWDLATGRLLASINTAGTLPQPDPVRFICFSPDGKLLGLGCGNGTMRVFEAATGKELISMRNHTGSVPGMAFSPDARLLACAREDGTVRLWDAITRREVRRLQGHTRAARGVAFSLDGKLLASCGDDGTVRLWDLATGQELRSLEGHKGAVNAVAFTPDGGPSASTGADVAATAAP